MSAILPTVLLFQDKRRFAGAVVRAGLSGNYTFNQPCGQSVTREQAVTGAVIEFPCAEPRLARYVTVDIDDTRPEVTQAVLMMAEVTIKIIPALQQGKNSHRLSITAHCVMKLIHSVSQWEHAPRQRVAASTLEQNSFGLLMAILQAATRPIPTQTK